jgi:hypothetical protein
MKTFVVVALFLAIPAGASAEPAPQWDVSLALPGLEVGALAVDAERDLPARSVSVVGGLGLRSAASGDFSSTTMTVGVEARHWLKRRALWSAQPRGAMVGWYVGGRLDASSVRLSDDVMDTTSDTLVLAGSALVGYRFAPWRGLTITPHMGITWRTEVDLEGRLPAARQGGLTFGLNTGWMF